MRKPLPTWQRITIAVLFLAGIVLMALGCGNSEREANAAWNRGVQCSIASNYPCAISEIGRAVRLQPDNAQYRVSLGYALMGAKMYEQAVYEFEAAIRIDPSNVEARRHLARLTR